MPTKENGKHTPGPWTVTVIDTDAEFWNGLSKNKESCVVGRGVDVIALIYSPGDRKEDVANARLIAVAPKLLSAAKEAILCSELCDSVKDALRSAIAAAEPR